MNKRKVNKAAESGMKDDYTDGIDGTKTFPGSEDKPKRRRGRRIGDRLIKFVFGLRIDLFICF